MKTITVKIRKGAAGYFDGKPYKVSSGSVVSLPEGLAKDLLNAGIAEPAKVERKKATYNKRTTRNNGR